MIHQNRVVCKCGSDNIVFTEMDGILVDQLVCQECDHRWTSGPFERRKIQALIRLKRMRDRAKEGALYEAGTP